MNKKGLEIKKIKFKTSTLFRPLYLSLIINMNTDAHEYRD